MLTHVVMMWIRHGGGETAGQGVIIIILIIIIIIIIIRCLFVKMDVFEIEKLIAKL